jgi:formylglycine-generating enzyme required for sulfatase activity
VIGFAKNRDAWKHAEGNLKYPYPMLYAAPEIFKTSNPHPTSDLYSWAVMVYQMFCRQLPWPLDRFMGPYEQKYQSMSRNLNGADSGLIPEAMYNVLRSCLKLDPADRPQDLKSLLFLLQEQVPQIEWSYIEPGADDVQEAEPDTTVSVTVRAEQILETPEEEENIKPEDGEEAEQADSAIAADAEELSSEQAEPFEEEDVPIVAEDDEKRAEALNAFPEPNASSEPEPTDAIAQEELQDIQAVEENIQEDNQDLSNMRKFFIILMLISIAIVAYILIQHFLLRPKPSFEVTQDEIPQDVEEFTTETLTENKPLEMVWVPADTLIMGSIIPEADADEFPLLTIPLKGFMITPTELTQEQWNMVYSSNPSLNVGAHLPVENVSFYDAIDYCNAKSLKDGLNPAYDYLGTEIICDFDADGYRLPTEAEWEFAAKAGIGKNFMLYSGSDDPQEVAWYAENSLARSHIVATKQANALDLYDLSGNVYEWVWNWYAPYSYRISDLYSGPAEGTDKVIRGGSWYHNEDHLRTTSREYVKPYVKTGLSVFAWFAADRAFWLLL